MTGGGIGFVSASVRQIRWNSLAYSQGRVSIQHRTAAVTLHTALMTPTDLTKYISPVKLHGLECRRMLQK